MGPSSDPAAVVDAEGRVRGLGNLFVADASIMPVIPRANTNLTCMLIGLKVADVVTKA
jgi:choline dehydrogenase-like flavoprotein